VLDQAGQGMEVLLEPWAAFRMFGRPAELTAARERSLVESLAGTDWDRRCHLVSSALAEWFDAAPPCSPQVVRAWELLTRTDGAIPVARLAADVGWSERQLERRFREQIGLLPKAAARLLRFERALRLLMADRSAADTAVCCGYYDQAHLSREFVAMTGRTICQFRAERADLPCFPGDRATSVILSAGYGMPVLSKTRRAA
jgi:AraC-like DNA-binding protein